MPYNYKDPMFTGVGVIVYWLGYRFVVKPMLNAVQKWMGTSKGNEKPPSQEELRRAFDESRKKPD